MAGVNKVIIVGRLGNEPDQSGQDRYTTEIQGDVLQMLGDPKSTQAPAQAQAKPVTSPQPQAGTPADNFDDDIPF